MENQPNAIGSLLESAGNYVETRIDLLKLQAVSKSSDIVSSAVSSIVIALLFIFGLSVLNIGLSIWLGAVLGKIWYGFFIVGGVYVILAILLIAVKGKWLKTPLNDLLIKKMLN